MGQCEYSDGFLDGYHCKITKCKVTDESIVKTYCKMHTLCSHCPERGGDDEPRLREQRQAELKAKDDQKHAEQVAANRRLAAEYRQSASSHTPQPRTSSHVSTGDFLGGLFSELGLCIVVVAGVLVLFLLGYWLGWTGPWVQMQVPSSAVTDDMNLYTVRRESAHYFDVRSETFDKNGKCKLRAPLGFSDVYLEKDKASVWLGMCNLTFLNTGEVNEYTYEDAEALMLRPLLIQLQDAKKAPLDGMIIQITDAHGNELPHTALNGGLYVVLLPNDTADQSLTLYSDGYSERHIPVKGAHRLSKVIVTME